MEPTLSSETSAFKLQTPGKFPKEHRLHSKHGESLETTVSNNIFANVRYLKPPLQLVKFYFYFFYICMRMDYTY